LPEIPRHRRLRRGDPGLAYAGALAPLCRDHGEM